MDKEFIRNLMVKKRDELSQDEVKCASYIITKKLTDMKLFKEAKAIMVYYPFRNEVDTLDIIKASFDDKTVCLPRIETEYGIMTARKITESSKLSPDRYGILSPPATADKVEPEELDIVLVPLVAFDRFFHRIGYGGGYYDRFLPACSKAFKCGLGYSFQKTEDFDRYDHDVMLDAVVTEV